MMDGFDQRSFSPMLIKKEQEPFDSRDYVYELKMDGIRCLMYVAADIMEIRNKENFILSQMVPELKEISQAVRGRCVLDGELIIMEGGKPNFERVASRVMTIAPTKIELASRRLPASFVAFDILYQDGMELVEKPLMERKDILRRAIVDSQRIVVSKVFDQGMALFDLTIENELEGVVAKRKDSLYQCGKPTRDWVKFKNLKDEDLTACGYIRKENGMVSLVLGEEKDGALYYRGHVTIGATLSKVAGFPTATVCPFGGVPQGNEDAIWFAPPFPMCTVVYMERTSGGGMRQPRLKKIGYLI